MNARTDVAAKISAVFDRLSRGHQQVARFVVDNEYFVAFNSAADVAEKADVSTATVVRFCQSVGYEGYPDLQAAIRNRFPRFMTTIQRVEERLTSPIPEDDIMARVFAADIDNIKQTMESVDRAVFDQAVSAICGASNIIVIGEALSAPPALFFSHSLQVMGFPVRVVTTGGVSLSVELSALQPNDLLIGISFWRYFRETFLALYKAGEVGAKRIAISDSELSPLTQVADFAFVVSINGVAHSISPIASMSLINAFIATLFFKRKKQTLGSLRKVDEAYREGKLLLEE
jgi:DNA-binding MurR/RpiR family transcriptional regulator